MELASIANLHTGPKRKHFLHLTAVTEELTVEFALVLLVFREKSHKPSKDRTSLVVPSFG